MKTSKKKIEDPFADTLQVRKICSGDTEVKNTKPKTENTAKRDKYCIKPQLPDYERRKTEKNIDETGLKYFLPEKKKISKMTGLSEKINIPRQLRRAQLGSEIKMISVNLPRFGRCEAVISSNTKEKIDHESSLNNQSDGASDQLTFNYDQPSNVLEDAQREIDISQNQLEKIQTILKNRNSEESYSLKPKWDSVATKKTSKVNSKERVISTLTTLNKKLNDMQEKYFSSTKNSYKSIRDFSSKMKAQSISDVEITESTSDVQIEGKDKILEKFHLSRMNLLPDSVSEKIGISIHNIGDNREDLDSTPLNFPTGEKAMTDVIESSSDFDLPTEARNNIIERFPLSERQKIYENFKTDENENKYADKCQNFSTTIPDRILQGNESISDITQCNVERDSFFELLDDASEIGLVQDTQDISRVEQKKEITYEEGVENNFSGKEIERLRKLLLTQDRKSSEKMKSEKSLNFVLPRESNASTLKAEYDSTKSTAEIAKVNVLKSKSSETPYFDCDSKSASPGMASSSSKKKIFYDNFGRYSNLIHKEDGKNTAGNSVPNLSSNRFISCETMTRSDKEIFDNTPLQNDLLKSDYLTKHFTVNSSGNFSESYSNQITKNKSDQFFNGGLDFTNLETKKCKGSKMTKDMYLTLSKALSNSFYKMPPQI